MNIKATIDKIIQRLNDQRINSLFINNNYEDDEDVMKNNLTTSEKIIKRLNEQHINFFANDNISSFISDEELSDLQYEVEEKAEALLRSLVIDTNRDHNTRNTAKRIAKMLLRETLNGRYESPPQITSFPNVKLLDEMVITKAEIKSLCSHHFQNISGFAYIGILYGENVLGLSKINRIAEHFARRPQIQEELIVQIADFLEREIKPRGIGIIIRAEHFCVSCRGVNQDSWMTTSVMRGEFRDNPSLKAEFLHLIEMSNKNL